MQKLKATGIKTSALICPVIPYISDVGPLIDLLAGHADKIWIYGLSILNRSDRNWQNVTSILESHFPDLKAQIETVVFSRNHSYHLIDRIGRGPAVVYFFSILIVSVFLVSKIDTRMLPFLIGALFGSRSALCSPALSAFVADETRQQARGTVFGFSYGAFDTGVIIARLIMGVIADLTTLRDMIVILSLSGLACLVVFAMTIKDTVPDSIKWSLAGK